MSALAPRFEDWAPALAGGDYGEAYLEDYSSLSLSWEDGKLQEVSEGADRGAGLRYLLKEPDGRSTRTLYGSTNGLDPKAAAQLAAGLLEGRPRPRPPAPGRREVRPHWVYRRPEQAPLEEKAALLERVDRMVRAESPVSQVSLVYGERVKRFAILNSEGDCLIGERISVIFAAHVTAEKDGLLQSGHEVVGGLKGYELLDDDAALKAARAAARAAVEKLSAPPAPAGEMPVVLASSAGGTFVHEAIGHSLEADHVQEGSSPHYVGKLGKTVAREFLTIVDDPTLPFARGSYPFDDEGCAARPVPLVKDGVLTDYLYDRATAMKDGRASNAHGRRESFRHRPIPRMSNLYIAPGSEDPADIVRSLSRGLLVTRMGGGQVNTATGEFVFGVDEGFLIEDGVVKHRVRDGNMLGIGPEVLLSIDRIGWDMGWGIGTCGKGGQGVPVSDGQPTLRIPKILIGGREEA